jgi:hypothetical protein
MVVGLAVAVGSSPAFAVETPPAPAPASGDLIAVSLVGGRTYTAALDARTDSVQLWLRFETDGAEILRPIRWDRVAWAEVAGQKIPGEELHGLVEQIRQEIPALPVAPAVTSNIVLIGAPDVDRAPESRAARPSNQAADTRRVVSLAIDAGAARWDENVDTDGLLVHVYPLDANGAIVPVRGTLNVDLTVERLDQYRLTQPFADGGHWEEAVHTADFGPTGAVYRLRFQSLNPEFNHWVGATAAVHATLAIPGQGTFEATADMACIRPFSTVRNHLEQMTNHRYFPNERTDDGRH